MKRNYFKFYALNAANWWDNTWKFYVLYDLNLPELEFFDCHCSNWQGLQVFDIGYGGDFSGEFMDKRGAIVSKINQSLKCIQIAQQHALNNPLKFTKLTRI